MSNEEESNYSAHTELPTKNGWFIDIPFDPNLDIVLICRLTRTDAMVNMGHGPEKKTYDDFGVGIKIVMRLALTDNLVDVDIHSAIVAPIVGQRDDETDVVGFRGCNDVVLRDDVRDLAMQENAD